MTQPPELSALMNGVTAARLRRDRNGSLSLLYDKNYMDDPNTIPLSLSLPFMQHPHKDVATTRWVRSLLPDNPNVLAAWYARENVPERTPFGLLTTRIGLDCAGAVQFCPVGEEERISERASGITELTPSELKRTLDTAVSDLGVWLPEDVEPYFSLAGFQPKLALHRVGGGWGRPYGNVPTTHILKPRSETTKLVAVTEHLCLNAATGLGLNAASSSIEQHGDSTVLVVERYDRANHDGEWTRIHQEDLCQALGVDGTRKYEHSGGPSIPQVRDLIARHSTRPDTDPACFADALIFAWLVVNRDAHARNYSLLYPQGSVELSPLYDVNSSLMFKGRGIGEAVMAMRYGNTFSVYSSGSKHALPNVARWLRLPTGKLIDRAEQLTTALPGAMESAMDTLPPDLQSMAELDEFTNRLSKRTTECLRTIHAARKHSR